MNGRFDRDRHTRFSIGGVDERWSPLENTHTIPEAGDIEGKH